jgi:SET domain-containing protein
MHDLASSSKPQPAFQYYYVAMRDIEQGEELYLDYGLDLGSIRDCRHNRSQRDLCATNMAAACD